jgi:acyl-CoA thioester hydrolase
MSRVPRFDTAFRVQFDDVDLYGIVHHARYVIYMERGRLDLFDRIGHGPSGEPGLGHGLLVGAIDMRFKKPSRLLDPVCVQTWCEGVHGAVLRLRCQIRSGDELRAEGHAKLVYTADRGKVRRIPAAIKAALLDAASEHADGFVDLDA